MNWMRSNCRPRELASAFAMRRLGDAGDALEEDVPAGEEAGLDELELLRLADDHLGDLREYPVREVLHLRGLAHVIHLTHHRGSSGSQALTLSS